MTDKLKVGELYKNYITARTAAQEAARAYAHECDVVIDALGAAEQTLSDENRELRQRLAGVEQAIREHGSDASGDKLTQAIRAALAFTR